MPGPLIPVSEGLEDSRALLISIAGTAANLALIAAVIGVVIAAVMFGLGIVMHRPELSSKGVSALLGVALAAVLAVGLNTWIAWFGEKAISIWN